MEFNKTLTKAFQKVWNREWIYLGKGLELTDDQAECLAKTLIQWKVYNKLNLTSDGTLGDENAPNMYERNENKYMPLRQR